MKESLNKITGNAPAGFKAVSKKYGEKFAKTLEQLFRLETNHFKSDQWLKTGTPGMIAFADSFPYGWSSLKTFADKKGLTEKDFFTKTYSKTSDGKPHTYIGFKNTGNTVEFVADFIHYKRNDDFASWYRMPNKGYDNERAQYLAKLSNIPTSFV